MTENTTGIPNTIHRTKFMLIADNSGGPEDVCVFVGRPPEDATPTVVNARLLRDALDDFLEDIAESENE